jgi:hypothetical protein
MRQPNPNRLIEDTMESFPQKIIVWKNLSFKDKCWFVFFMSFAFIWIFVALALTFKSSNLNPLQMLFMPFAMFGYLLNPHAFQNPKQLNKSHFPQISKICFAIGLFFFCTPFWSALIK